MKTRKTIKTCLAMWLVATGSVLAEQPRPQPLRAEPYRIELGADGVTADSAFTERQTIEYAGASLMQLRFGEVHLGQGSYVTVMSLLDGGFQKLDAAGIESWSGFSALFNGDALELELHRAEGDDASVAIESVFVNDPPGDQAERQPSVIASICGASDNRIASSDSRVARLSKTGFFPGGCTAWLISNGAVLTAGHCGPAGDLSNQFIEFNVPTSLSDGRTRAADPGDQYPVNNSTYHWYANGGIGDDWQIFVVSANTTTGLRAHIAQGFFRLTDGAPAVDSTLRLTGFGFDNIPSGSGGSEATCCDTDGNEVCEYNCNSTSGTQQTSTGRLDDIQGYDIEHEVDSMPATSGGPLIWESNGLTIGIHTHSGCDDFFLGNNNFGTHFAHPTLAARINDYRGSNAVYVDTARNLTFALGTAFRPHDTVALGAATVPSGGVVSIVEGSYPASAGNTFTAGADGKQMTLEAPVGVVTIGN